ncbi:MAG: hypothetical protein WBC63_04360 [Candidatus Bipolaricaulia bacterium]
MSRNDGKSSLGKLFVEAGKLIGEFPVILIPAVIPSFWAFIAPLTGLINPAAVLTAGYVGFGVGAWRLLGYLLIYVLLLAVSQGATVVLVRDATKEGSVRLSKGFEEAVSRFAVLLTTSLVAGLIVSVASLVFVFPGLVAGFFLWYIVQGVIIDDATVTGALRSSFKFAATYAGETFAIILAALVISFAFSYIPFVGWLLMIPTTAYFATLSTLLYIQRET